MEKTMGQITHSMKSTLITLLPVFLIFGWMSGNLANDSIKPGEEFTASMTFKLGTSGSATLTSQTLEILSNATAEIKNNRAEWKLKGTLGKHQLTYNYKDESYSRDALITTKWQYEDPYLEKKKTLLGIINTGDKNPIKPESDITRAAVELKPLYPLGDTTILGWKPGWLATYFIFTLLLTYPMRRILKVH